MIGWTDNHEKYFCLWYLKLSIVLPHLVIKDVLGFIIWDYGIKSTVSWAPKSNEFRCFPWSLTCIFLPWDIHISLPLLTLWRKEDITFVLGMVSSWRLQKDCEKRILGVINGPVCSTKKESPQHCLFSSPALCKPSDPHGERKLLVLRTMATLQSQAEPITWAEQANKFLRVSLASLSDWRWSWRTFWLSPHLQNVTRSDHGEEWWHLRDVQNTWNSLDDSCSVWEWF